MHHFPPGIQILVSCYELAYQIRSSLVELYRLQTANCPSNKQFQPKITMRIYSTRHYDYLSRRVNRQEHGLTQAVELFEARVKPMPERIVMALFR